MAYRYKTRYYRIPVMGEGDILTEEQEWIQMATIDNLLYASNFGCINSFLEEGEYSLKWDRSHAECRLQIRPVKNDGFSLLGMINGRLFASKETVSIGSLYSDAIYYVYIEYQGGLELDSTNFAVIAYLDQQKEDDKRMALCIVDTYKGTIEHDVGKTYAKNILAHTMDSTNPHGRTMYQENLEIGDKLSVKGNAIRGSVYATAVTAGNGNKISIPINGGIPVYATIYPEMLSAGEIAWKIDGNVLNVWNSGDGNVVLNIKVDVK